MSKLWHPFFCIPLVQALFEGAWALLAAWTPKPFNLWRLFILRIFGCRIEGHPFVHSRARITRPWNLTLHDKACLGDRAAAYALGKIELEEGCLVAQEAYLCTGTHDFENPARPLVVAPIVVGKDAFVGARAFVMPGVKIGVGAKVGACAVVIKEVTAHTTVAGNPAKPVGNL